MNRYWTLSGKPLGSWPEADTGARTWPGADTHPLHFARPLSVGLQEARRRAARRAVSRSHGRAGR
jgi:hypothetical protein